MRAEEQTAAAFGFGLGSGLFPSRAGARNHELSLPVELEAVATARPDPA